VYLVNLLSTYNNTFILNEQTLMKKLSWFY